MNQKEGFHRVFTGNAFHTHEPIRKRPCTLRRVLRALLAWFCQPSPWGKQ
ncbi:MAG: hypothetical protein ACKOF9_03740 [Burkholderiales bacterium]